jgi:hypothetical protein
VDTERETRLKNEIQEKLTHVEKEFAIEKEELVRKRRDL